MIDNEEILYQLTHKMAAMSIVRFQSVIYILAIRHVYALVYSGVVEYTKQSSVLLVCTS